MKVESINKPKKDDFPFLATRNRCGFDIPVVVCYEKDREHYAVYFPVDNYDVLQTIKKSDVTRLPSGSQIILTQE